MKLSIVIRCCNDFRIFQCINSIDEDVEVIVSLCKNQKIISQLEQMNIKYCIVPKGNLSITSNRGVEIASNEKIILIDSDTTFKKNTIKKVYLELNRINAVNLKIIFLTRKNQIFSDLVSKTRSIVNSQNLFFTPGIAFNTKIIANLGGYLFNEKISFAVDAELNYRMKLNKINFSYLESAIIYHDAESIRHDLNAAYRIGKGVKTGEYYILKNYTEIHNLKVVKPKIYPQIIRKFGFMTFFYQIIWDLFFLLGYFKSKNHQ